MKAGYCTLLIYKTFALFILLFVQTTSGYERPGIIEIKNLISDDSGQSGYNWNVVWDADGVAYIGRDRLWRWDGSHMLAVGPEQIINLRGMAFGPDGRLWLGGYNSFGVYDPRSGEYTSHLDWLPEQERTFGEVWNLHHDGDFIWLATDRLLFRVRDGSYQKWKFGGDHRVIFHFLQSGVYAHEVGHGLWQIVGDAKTLLSDDPRVAEESVMYVNPLSSGILYTASSNGVILINKNGTTIQNIDADIIGLKISSVCRLDDTSIIIGTLGQGIWYLAFDENSQTHLVQNYDYGNLLITKIKKGPNSDLWILDTTRIQSANFERIVTTTRYTDYSGGAYTTSLRLANHSIYVSGDVGLFRTSDSIPGYNPVELIYAGEIFKCTAISDTIIFDSYSRLMRLEGGAVEVFHDFGRALRTFDLTEDGRLVAAFSDRVEVYQLGHDDVPERVGGFATAAGAQVLETDAAGRTWGWSPRMPLLEISEEAGGWRMREHVSVAGRRLTEEDHAVAMSADGPVMIFGDALARPSAAQAGDWDLGAYAPGLGRAQAQHFRRAGGVLEGWVAYWSPVLNTSLLVEVEWPDGGAPAWRILPWMDMREIGRIDQLRVEGERMLVSGMKGLLVADLAVSATIPPPRRPVLWDLDRASLPAMSREFKYGRETLRYSYSSPLSTAQYPVLYQTRVAGLEPDWSEPGTATTRELGTLEEGRYRFEVRAVDPFGRASEPATVAFRIFPPWHRSAVAYAGMAALLVLVVVLAVVATGHWHRRRQLVLERLVELRTAELRQANVFKDEFIANLSHEIRNPLNGVIGLIGQLREGDPPPARNLSALRGAARYLRSTVEDVLDFSKLGSGVLTVSIHPFDILQVTNGVAGIYGSKAEEKGVSLTSKVSVPDGCAVVSDERKVQQIIGNLTSNAVKFTRSGGVDLAVRVEPSGAPGDAAGAGDAAVLRIDVTDTGIGIPEQERARIFEKFYQVRTDALKPSGTGIGLALVKAYVDALGGTLELRSNPGHGSTFSVTIPARLERLAGDQAAGRDSAVAASGMKVLIVEDMEYNRIVMEGLLHACGCRVDTAADGRVGLEMALTGGYAAVFLDWDLPSMNGLDIAKALRASGQVDPRLLLVGMTAYATTDIQQRCLEGGMDAFLTKPLDSEAVRRLLRTRLPAPAPAYVLGRGLLAEMPGSDDWEATKARWRQFFDGYVADTGRTMEGGDPEAARKAAHKLLGHLRMLKVQGLPEILQDLQTAAHAGDMEGVRLEWAAFRSELPAFLDELDRLS